MSSRGYAYLNAVIGVLGVLAGMKPELFPAFIPTQLDNDIIQTAGFTLALWGGVNVALHVSSLQTAAHLAQSVQDEKTKALNPTNEEKKP